MYTESLIMYQLSVNNREQISRIEIILAKAAVMSGHLRDIIWKNKYIKVQRVQRVK